MSASIPSQSRSLENLEPFDVLLREKRLEFPYKRYTYPDTKPFFLRLQQFVPVFEKKDYKRVAGTQEIPWEYQGSLTYIPYQPSEYENINLLTDLYTPSFIIDSKDIWMILLNEFKMIRIERIIYNLRKSIHYVSNVSRVLR